MSIGSLLEATAVGSEANGEYDDLESAREGMTTVPTAPMAAVLAMVVNRN
jgi:hypothetical protein